MKKLSLFILFFLLFSASSFAASTPKKPVAKNAKEVKVAPVVTPAAIPAAAQLSAAELESKAKETLNKKEWGITFIPIGNAKAKQQADTLTFQGSRVSSKRLSTKGFIESNYTLRVLADGTAIWETMQKNDKDEVVFWKGELRGEMMTGVFSFHPKKGGNEDFSFATPVVKQP